MKFAAQVALFLGVAAGLSAQGTLSFGEIYQTSPQTNPPTYMVDINLASGGTAAGVQFDLTYTASQLNVVVGLGSSAVTAGLQASTTALSPTLNNPFCVNQGNCVEPLDQGPGQRVILIGCCSTAQTNGNTAPTANSIPDGPVATLTITLLGTPNATNEILNIPSIYLGATTPGSNTVAAASIPLTIAGPNDGSGNGQINLYNDYMVGSLNPYTGHNNAPNFGSGKLQLSDLVSELLYQTGAPGYTLPASCTDFFDAMDTSPADTATTRGGDGQITLADLILELERQTGAPGFSVLPIRTPRGETCATNTIAHVRTAALETRGTLVLGSVEGAGSTQERVPVYLQAGRDLSKVGVAFSVGDGTSKLQFQPGGAAPTLLYDSQPGFVSAAFLAGLDARSGDRVLLGYVVGPAGSGVNVRVYGVTAAGLTDNQDFGVDFQGATARQ